MIQVTLKTDVYPPIKIYKIKFLNEMSSLVSKRHKFFIYDKSLATKWKSPFLLKQEHIIGIF